MTVHTDTLRFFVGFLAWLAVVAILSFESMRRLRYPTVCFFVGLALLGFSFFCVHQVSSIATWRMGQEMYQFQVTFHYFRVIGLTIFLVFFIARGGYLLFHARRRDNVAS